MKLKNKKTGEIVNLDYVGNVKAQFGGISVIPNTAELGGDEYVYHSLKALTEDWGDYEEPKDFWYIDDFMIMCGTEGEFTTPDLASFTKKDIEKLKAIGNFFETKEEVEEAVEKLKAWKRLKDKGFEFEYCGEYENFTDTETVKDLDLLFSREDV